MEDMHSIIQGDVWRWTKYLGMFLGIEILQSSL